MSACLVAGGCSKLERLSIVKPTAERGDYTQVAPTYDVSDKGRTHTAMAAGEQLASANELFRGGKLAQAEQQAKRALKSNPRLGDAHLLLAMVADSRGDDAATGRHYEQAVALAPANGMYANNYGAWLCGNGRAVESLAWFDRALADPAYPTRAAAFANAGSCSRDAGQSARAEANWRQALALDSVNVPALSGMADLQFRSGRYLDARAFAERWLAVSPGDANGLRLALQIEQKLGDNVAAQRYLARLQALSPGTTTAPRAQ
ncbi:MAG: type IV pilus biogenesis/stability protein PilW [Pseudomonadota bacterium]